MQPLNETLLASWVRLSTAVINNRVVSEIPYNESLVCHILYKNTLNNRDAEMTATDLCEKTHILKSQMNRILNRLEEKNLINRRRSQKDKRQVMISFNLDHADAFKKQHDKIIDLLNSIIDEIGVEKAKEAVDIFNDLSNSAAKILG